MPLLYSCVDWNIYIYNKVNIYLAELSATQKLYNLFLCFFTIMSLMYLRTSSSSQTRSYFNKLHAKVLLEQPTGRQVVKKSVARYVTSEVVVTKHAFFSKAWHSTIFSKFMNVLKVQTAYTFRKKKKDDRRWHETSVNFQETITASHSASGNLHSQHCESSWTEKLHVHVQWSLFIVKSRSFPCCTMFTYDPAECVWLIDTARAALTLNIDHQSTYTIVTAVSSQRWVSNHAPFRSRSVEY